MKQLEVQIMGQNYVLGCPENGDTRMLDAVSRVNVAMCKIRNAGKVKARDRIAVLAALNLVFETPEEPAVPPAQLVAAPAPSTRADTLHEQITALHALSLRLGVALGLD